MRRLAGAALLCLLVAGTTGCPADWGFVGRVRVAGTDGVGAPVPSAQVICEGCKALILVDAKGDFVLDLGSTYDAPPPVLLHVSAPGYETIDLRVQKSPYRSSEAGPASVTFLLEPSPAEPPK